MHPDRHRSRIRAAAAGLATLVLAGCGGGADPAPDPAHAPLSAEVERADTRIVTGDLERAVEQLTAVLETAPDDFHAWYRLAWVQLVTDPAAAESSIVRARELSPAHPGPRFLEGFRVVAHDPPGATREFIRGWHRALARRQYSLPDTTPGVAAALAAVESHRPREAVPVLRDFADAAPEDAVRRFLHARAVYLAGDVYTAEELARAAIGADSTLAVAHGLRAACLYRMSRRDDARAAGERALALDDREPLARHILGHMELERSNYTDAFRDWWLALLEDPSEPEFYKYLGGSLIRYGSRELGAAFLHQLESVLRFEGRYLERPGY